MTSIIINGACGKMGRVVTEVAAGMGLSVVAGVDRYAAGAKAYYPLYEKIEDCVLPADVVVDFSRPDALPGLLKYCTEHNMGLVLATTGYTAQDLEAIKAASEIIPIFKTANMSVGVNIMLDLVRKAAMSLPEFDIEIVEKHHNAKVDAPSGTALLIADAMKQVCLNEKEYVFGRTPASGRRQRAEIGIHAVRGGTVTGEHEVYFFGNDEVVTITHQAASRKIFAIGAIKAAEYLQGKKPGIYDMQDVLLAHSGVTNLYVDRTQTVLTLRGLALSQPARVFEAMANADVSVDMISQTMPVSGRIDLSITLDTVNVEKAFSVFSAMNLPIECDSDVAKVVIEGSGMERQTGIAAGVFAALETADVYPSLISTSETKIGLIVKAADADKAAAAIREKYAL